jgi:hypothetical protein
MRELFRGIGIMTENFLVSPEPNDMKPGDLYRIVDGGPCFGGRKIRLVKVSKRVKA